MRETLAARENWQNEAAQRGAKAECAFYLVMSEYCKRKPRYEIAKKPQDLCAIYGTTGIIPDYRITDTQSGRSMWLEMKRQRAAGNAHERACKYFAPGIIHAARKIGNLSCDIFPFWLIFTNGITTHERYRSEIKFWFRGIENHLLLWKDFKDGRTPVRHFEKYIAPLLNNN